MLKTGIPKLDDLLDGGIKENTFTTLWTSPGLDASPFAYQIANNVAKTNDVIYVINSKNPEAVKKDMESYGFKTDKINFVDAYSGMIGKKPSFRLSIANPRNIKQFADSIAKISKNFESPFIILDSLSTTIDVTGNEPDKILNLFKKIKATWLFSFTSLGGGVKLWEK